MNRSTAFKVITVLLALAALCTGFYVTGLFDHLSMGNVKDYIESYGPFAALIYVFLFVVRTFLVVFPSSVMVVLGGSLFGHMYGFAYSMFAIFISASMAFFIGRKAGAPAVNRILGRKMKRMQLLDSKIGEHGFKIIFFMRVSVLFPFDIINYMAGLTKIRYKDFILGTVLGIVPETFSLTLLGSNLHNPFSRSFAVSIVLVLVTIVVPFVCSKVKKHQE